MPTVARRLPSESQYRRVIEDVREVVTEFDPGGMIRSGWFTHEDGDPLWFAEWYDSGTNLRAMSYGDTRAEAVENVRRRAREWGY